MKRWLAACVTAAAAVATLATSTVVPAAAIPAPPSPKAPAPTADKPSVATADMAALVGSIPVNHRYQCSLTEPGLAGKLLQAELVHVRAFMECYGVSGLRLFWYALFDDNASLDRAYRAYAGSYDPDAPYRDEDAQCPGESGWGFGGRSDQGLLACYYTQTDVNGENYGGETAVLIWKYDPGRILALAQTAVGDSNAAALKQWWENDSGPLQAPERDKYLVDWTAKNTNAERTLLTHVPRRFRPTCRVQRGDTGGSFFTVRHLVLARAACKAGDVSVVYAAVPSAIIQNFMKKYQDIARPPEGQHCPDIGEWWIGSGENRRVMGEYACWANPEFDGRTTAQIVWSHNALGIVAVAALPTGDGDFNRIWDWWNGDVGPN
jgi:hypothetical protein